MQHTGTRWTCAPWHGLGLAVLMLASTGQAWSQSAEMFGVTYEPTITVDSRPLHLNGTGVAFRALAKLYTVGLYVPTKSQQASTVLGMAGPKQLRFVMLQGMRVDELGKAITNGIEANSSREQFFRLIPAIRAMGEQFGRMPRLAPHDVVTLDDAPQRGTVIAVNGQAMGAPIKDPAFFPAVLRVWLGDKPNTMDLKNALLDSKAQPVLSALE